MELIPLRADERPCLSCGVAAALEGPPLVVSSTGMRGERVTLADGSAAYRSPSVELTRCPACAQRRDACVQLLADHPQLVTDGQALDRLEATADALDVLGQPVPSSAASARLHVRHLATVGNALRYVGLLVPSWREGVTPDVADAAPWGHLTDELRHTLYEAYAAVLRERAAASAPPTRLPPPSGIACLFCGVPFVLMPAVEVAWRGGPFAAADDVWRAVNTSTAALGARGGDRRVPGHLCPLCAHALELTGGAVGYTALEQALSDYLRSVGRDAEADRMIVFEVPGLVGWGALGTAEPNAQPWAHTRVGAKVG